MNMLYLSYVELGSNHLHPNNFEVLHIKHKGYFVYIKECIVILSLVYEQKPVNDR